MLPNIKPIETEALEIEAKLSRLEPNQKIKIIPRRADRIRPPEFTGKFAGIVKTDIIQKNKYPFPAKIILVAQDVGKKEPKIVRIPNFLIEKIKNA